MTEPLHEILQGASMPTGFLNVLDFEERIGMALVVQDAHDDELVALYEVVEMSCSAAS